MADDKHNKRSIQISTCRVTVSVESQCLRDTIENLRKIAEEVIDKYV